MSHLPLYTQRGISLERGREALVWDTNGREYIDCIGGIGTASIGHAHPRIAEALTEQASKIISVSGAFANPTRDTFVEKLASITPEGLDRVFLCNSGTEAIEAAIKLARYTSGKPGIISAVRAYHGRTLGALSATHAPAYREPFLPLVEGFAHVPYNDASRIEEAIDENTAAVLLEPIQGEGGVHVPDDGYLRDVRRICDEHGVILILDEVQTGMCRTGRMFACEHDTITPDILCLAKAIAGGVPMGALVCTDRIEVPTGRHGTTFGGNPLSCAAGNAALDIMIEESLASQAHRKGTTTLERLRSIRSARIRDVRGRGLLIGIELKEKAKPYVDELARRGILVMPTGPRIIRLIPPLVITDEQLETVCDAIEDVLR